MNRDIIDNQIWVEYKKDIAIIGLTDDFFADLDEIVGIDFAEKKKVKKGETLCVLESNKAAIDIDSPIDGKIIEVNSNFLKDRKWLVKMRPVYFFNF